MKTVVLVDAGSGYSRCSLYSGAVPLAVPDSASKLPGNALARVIRDNQDLEFLEGLMEVIKEMNLDSASGGVDVFIGATAGVRSALDDGTVRPCEIDRFTETVKKFFRHPFHGRFEVISGEQEALMEMVSVEHAVNALGLVEAGSPLGLISSGGMSSQVVFTQQTTGDLKALSIATSLKSNQPCLALGARTGSRNYAEFLASLEIETSVTGVSPRSLFIVIEMLAKVGSVCGIGKQKLSTPNAIATIAEHLENVAIEDCEAKERDGEVKNSMTWKDVVEVGLMTQALALLRALPEDSEIYFCREFDLGEALGGEVKATWGLGKVLELLDAL